VQFDSWKLGLMPVQSDPVCRDLRVMCITRGRQFNQTRQDKIGQDRIGQDTTLSGLLLLQGMYNQTKLENGESKSAKAVALPSPRALHMVHMATMDVWSGPQDIVIIFKTMRDVATQLGGTGHSSIPNREPYPNLTKP